MVESDCQNLNSCDLIQRLLFAKVFVNFYVIKIYLYLTIFCHDMIINFYPSVVAFFGGLFLVYTASRQQVENCSFYLFLQLLLLSDTNKLFSLFGLIALEYFVLNQNFLWKICSACPLFCFSFSIKRCLKLYNDVIVDLNLLVVVIITYFVYHTFLL